MNMIVTEIYDALKEAGATEAKARAAAGAIPMVENLATKRDLAELKAATQQDIAELKQAFAQLKASTQQDIAELRAELKGGIAELRAELKGDIAELRAELKGDIAELKRDVAVLKLAVFSGLPTIVALLVKLAFFP